MLLNIVSYNANSSLKKFKLLINIVQNGIDAAFLNKTKWSIGYFDSDCDKFMDITYIQ